jgi:hypothetical protein
MEEEKGIKFSETETKDKKPKNRQDIYKGLSDSKQNRIF